MAEARDAEQFTWESPGGVLMTLTPERNGSLQIEVENGMVTISGSNCRHTQGEDAKTPGDVARQHLTEIQMTVLTTRCTATWRTVHG
jgi:hypothetical protein